LVSYTAAVDRRAKATVAVVPVTDGYEWMRLLRSRQHFEELLAAVDADRAERYAGRPGRRIPVAALAGELCGIPSDPDVIQFFGQLQQACPSWRDTITLESIERILEFSPLAMVARITPRPYLIISTAGHDVVHPADSVAELFERARQPKRLEFLPYAQTELYVEPGLSRGNQLALDFYREHLGV
jgi:hypothetical protein